MKTATSGASAAADPVVPAQGGIRALLADLPRQGMSGDPKPPNTSSNKHVVRVFRIVARLCLLAASLLGPRAADAAEPADITVRTGSHSDFGRVVFDVPPGTYYRLARNGDQVTLRFEPDLSVADATALPRNVRSVRGGAHEAVVTMAPGATMHDMRLGDHVVVDVFDPADGGASAGASAAERPSPQAPYPARTPQPIGMAPDAPPLKENARAAGAAATPAGAAGIGPAERAAITSSERTTTTRTPATPSTPAAPSRPHPAGQATPPPADHRLAPSDPRALAPSDPRAAAAPPNAAAPSQSPSPGTTQAAAIETPPARADHSAAAAEPNAATPRAGASRSQASSPAAPLAAATPGPSSAVRVAVLPMAASAAAPAKPAVAPAAPAIQGALPPPGIQPTGAQSPGTPPAGTQLPPPASNEQISDPAMDSATGPMGLIATLVPPPAGTQGSAFSLPFPSGVGAAAFRRGDADYVVFDTSRPLDLGALRRDKVLWRTTIHLLPSATLLRLELPLGLTVALTPTPRGWTVTALADAPHPSPIEQTIANGRLLLAADAPGLVVTIADPETGATLLVGTQHEAGQAVAIRRSGPEFALLPSWQGVLVEALSDHLALRAVPKGFALSADPGGLALSTLPDDALADAATLTRRFSFPDLPTATLHQRITLGMEQASAIPTRARGPRREVIARDMITLGMGAEAQSLLRMAVEEDPNLAESASTAGLMAIAALLADRPADAEGLEDPRLNGSDDIAFWRAVRLAEQDEVSPEAASVFAVTAPLALTYPEAMRDRLLPLVLETMLRGGQAAAAQVLLARGGNQPGLGLTRAMADEAGGKIDAALTAYDAEAKSADQRASSRAAVRAVELRLAHRRISVQQAADALDRLLYAWRGDKSELKMRERLSALRQQSGEWRAALTVLREAKPDFPTEETAIQGRMQDVFADLLRGEAVDRMPPIELVALVDENADALPVSAGGEELQAHLADRLLALDLPNRAGPVLEKLMRTAPSATGRAGFGARLAALRLREGDAPGAQQALVESAATALPTDLADRRKLLFAAASARRGDFSAALAAIAGLDSSAAAEQRAAISEQAQDWPEAARALADYVAKTVPESGALDDAQRHALLHLATIAARAGDMATLSGLNARDSVRIGSGPLADMFHLLTAAPIRTTADLQRSRREAGLVQALPASLKALRSP